jgi:hypothetical protein
MKLAATTTRCKAKHKKMKWDCSYVPAASTISTHVERMVPLATGLTTSTLPATSGAYAAKTEDKGEW